MAEQATEKGVNEIQSGERNLDAEFKPGKSGTRTTVKTSARGSNATANARRNQQRKKKKQQRQNRKKRR